MPSRPNWKVNHREPNNLGVTLNGLVLHGSSRIVLLFLRLYLAGHRTNVHQLDDFQVKTNVSVDRQRHHDLHFRILLLYCGQY